MRTADEIRDAMIRNGNHFHFGAYGVTSTEISTAEFEAMFRLPESHWGDFLRFCAATRKAFKETK